MALKIGAKSVLTIILSRLQVKAEVTLDGGWRGHPDVFNAVLG